MVNVKRTKFNWSKIVTYISSIILIPFLFFINKEYPKDFDLLLVCNGLLNIVIAFVYFLEIKFNYDKVLYYNHSKFLFFSISRYYLIKKELLYFVLRHDIIILNILFLILCYRLYLYEESIFYILYFIVLFFCQFCFLVMIFLLVKNSTKEIKNIIPNISNTYMFLMFFVITSNSIINIVPSVRNLLYFSPFPGLFYITINNNFPNSGYFFPIIPLLLLVLLYLLNKSTKEWQL